MAKRLNPKRRREMATKLARIKLAKALNPTTQGEIGLVRTATPRTLFGSSAHLQGGLLHQEANLLTFAQHKRRAPTKGAMHVNPSDVPVIVTPDMIPSELAPDAKVSPVALKRLKRPDRLVPKGAKMWSGRPTDVDFGEPNRGSMPGIRGVKIDDGEDDD